MKLIDPLAMIEMCWPHVTLYNKQKEIIYSVDNNDETLVPAGNMLGKDFVSALIALTFFIRRHPCRVVTTSVDNGQLEKVLWGEIGRFVQTAAVNLPIHCNYLDIKKIVNGKPCPLSYIIGRVAAKEEGLLGHHLPRGENNLPHTLMIYDEASGINPAYKEKTDTWAHRTLSIGNPFPCENHFKQGVQAGDQLSLQGDRYYRKVIKIKAEDSPSVKLGLAQQKAGIPTTGEYLIPGVLGWDEYQKRRSTWDKIRQCVSLDAEFYAGAEILLFPPEWLNHSEQIARELEGKPRHAKAIGVDPAEGGDSSCWSVIDEFGLIELLSMKTPNTAVVPNQTIALMKQYGVEPKNVILDAGGGGKQHADKLREQGYGVRTVAFGESANPDPRRGLVTVPQKLLNKEEKYSYKNRRAEMYHLLRLKMDPMAQGFGIPAKYTELRRQLAPIPLTFDGEGRIWLLPKDKKNKDDKGATLKELIGCSPDEADSLVLANFGMDRKVIRNIAGAM